MLKLVVNQPYRPSGLTRTLNATLAKKTSANDSDYTNGFLFQDWVDLEDVLRTSHRRLNAVEKLFLTKDLLEKTLALEVHKCMDAHGIKRWLPGRQEHYSALERIALFEQSRKRKLVLENRGLANALVCAVQRERKNSLHEGQRNLRLELRKSVSRDLPFIHFLDLKRLAIKASEVLSPRQQLNLSLSEVSKVMANLVVSTLQAPSAELFEANQEAIIDSVLRRAQAQTGPVVQPVPPAMIERKPTALVSRPELSTLAESVKAPLSEPSFDYSLPKKRIQIPKERRLGDTLKDLMATTLGWLRPLKASLS